MSEDNPSKSSTATELEAAGVPVKKPSALGGLLRTLLPALLAAGAAYGGTRIALARGPMAGAHGSSEHEPPKVDVKPPGLTVSLEPFLVTVFDANRKAHAMKMTLAVEFDAHAKDEPKTFIPRIRDAILAHLRTLSHEQVTDPTQVEKLRTELVAKCKAVGAGAEHVLVTDFVVQ
jgi:flagellar basal body-associated protein FliL